MLEAGRGDARRRRQNRAPHRLLLRSQSSADITARRDAEAVQQRLQEEPHARNEELERISRTDHLTELSNRRHIEEHLTMTFSAAARHRRPAAVLLIDVDNFKRVNSELGYESGDAVLRAITRRMSQELRTEDTIGRWGGEDFLVVVAAAGIMLGALDGVLRVVGSSSEEMRVLELLEEQAADGPCLDSYRTGEPVTNEQLATALDRWPNFAPEALEAGFTSVQALPMRLRDNVIGALNLFHRDAHAISAEATELAQAFADVATIAILQNRASREAQIVNEQLTHALNSRIVIEQANGMIAERLGLDMADAFALLRVHARDHNLRLADVANDVIDGTITATSLG